MSETSEILSSGALANVTDLFKKLAGPAFEEFGAMLGDSVRVYRTKNLIKTTQKTQRILLDAGLSPEAVPSRFLLPLVDASSIEDDDYLQEQWAGLLSSASQDSGTIHPAFIETLKQLNPAEAKYLNELILKLTERDKKEPKAGTWIPNYMFTEAWDALPGAEETFERLGLIRRDLEIKTDRPSLTNLRQARTIEDALSSIEDALGSLDSEIGFAYELTEYAVRFLAACKGPHKFETAPCLNKISTV